MLWLIIILSSLCLFLCWLLVAPVELEIDTGKANAEFRWISVGGIRIWYEDEWWLSMRLFFFRKTISFSKIKKGPKKEIAKPTNGKRERKLKAKKIIQVIRTLQITDWQLAIDSGAFDWNARFYPLNFMLYTYGHLHINFHGENFLIAKIRGRPWKLLYAFLR